MTTEVAPSIYALLGNEIRRLKRHSFLTQDAMKWAKTHLRRLAQSNYSARFVVAGDLHDFALSCTGRGVVKLAYQLSSPGILGTKATSKRAALRRLRGPSVKLTDMIAVRAPDSDMWIDLV